MLAALAYWPVLQAGFVWDDDDYVTHNETLRSLAGLGRLWFEVGATPQYYPLVHTTFWIEYRLWGLHPAGYHVVNVLLHGLSAVLLLRVLRRLNVPGAWLAAALFAVHPVHVESVAWVTERKNTLSGVFYLAAALAYLRFVAHRGTARPARPAYVAFLVCFAAAMLSKTVTVSLPVALAIALWWQQGGRPTRRDLVPLLPALLIALPLALLTVWVERNVVGAKGADWDLSLLDRAVIAGRALWFYLQKLVWPVDLAFIYPRWNIDASAAWQLAQPAAWLALLGGTWLARARIGRGPVAALVFFTATLAPALGFFDVYPMRYSFVADHFQYLASLGPIILFAAAWTRFGHRFGVPVILAVLAVLAMLQCHSYRDLETLWRDTIRTNPSCQMAHTNLGELLYSRGEVDAAMPLYTRALELDPNDEVVLYNLGVAYADAGDAAQAERHYERAIAAEPDYAPALINLGKLKEQAGAPDAAVEWYERALRVDPEDPIALLNLGVALGKLGRNDEAAARYRQAIATNPRDAAPRANLAILLMGAGATEEALTEFRAAARCAPDQPVMRFNYANALFAAGQAHAAIVEYRAGLKLAPGDAFAHYNLARLLLQGGDRVGAATHFRAALAADPSLDAARRGLRQALGDG